MAYRGHHSNTNSDMYNYSANDDYRSRPPSNRNSYQQQHSNMYHQTVPGHHNHHRQPHQQEQEYYEYYDKYGSFPSSYPSTTYPSYNKSYSRKQSHYEEFHNNKPTHLSNYYDNRPETSIQQYEVSRSSVSTMQKREPSSVSATKPIVKSYKINNTSQTNLVSQIPNATTPPVAIESFKTTSIKDVGNSSEKKKQLTEKVAIPLSDIMQDPRNVNPQQYAKLKAKSFAYTPKKLYIPTYKFDKHSLGDKPSNEIVIWNLHSTTPAVLVKNTLSQYGKILDIKMIDDHLTAVPLGMCIVTFDGNFDEAHATALKVIDECNKKLLIQGRYIRCGLNVKNKLYNEIYEKSVSARKERLEKQKAEEKKRKEEQEKAAVAKSATTMKTPRPIVSIPSSTPKGPVGKKTVNMHDKHILPFSAFSLNYRIRKIINYRPYIFIADKFYPAAYVNSDKLGRFLSNYRVSSIIHQHGGFYIVFDDVDEAMKCFDEMDGKKIHTFVILMSVYIPDKFLDETRIGKSGARKAAKKQIESELIAYLFKDVREKIIGPMVVEHLHHPDIKELAMKAKEKKDIERREKQKDQPVTVKRIDLDVFKKLGLVKSRKSFVPVTHSLNKSTESASEDESESEESDFEVETANKRKVDLSEPNSKKSKFDDDEEENERESDIDVNKENIGTFKEATLDEIPVKHNVYDDFKPSTKLPGPVFTEIPFTPTLANLKASIFTDEDFDILKSLCKDVVLDQAVKKKSIEFWAWEHEEFLKNESILKENEDDDGEEAEEFDFKDEVLMNCELRNTSGCFKTEGYHKISDRFKREYLIHRRKLTNLNPVKQEDDDEINATIHNKIQSSRVNRANTRRFAADISAQKQIIGETDLLDLNQLNKRKKPVQFARSAIHNWGLYALEPINSGEMIIEYVGERIRQQIAELREKKYLRSGIGSSYLFRVDENTVIDASKKGGIARFINHCCEPSCTAKIIKVDGSKRIVIYALRDIKKNEELTYDYKFERETNDEERIVCLCGAPGCKGYLN
ncbi:hypothetical protein CANINC_002521 [Pichia inconspicua]|uniref:Histone-lysine N-methyltransferase, H3 lysine-4 specific n=1 Tax=Pichia inconspicua TaxID=52247 RepID=A0A4T0X1C1_9ASCO|nr:hypothetical protein CANINC_002521 [[Candida] inconspicua]